MMNVIYDIGLIISIDKAIMHQNTFFQMIHNLFVNLYCQNDFHNKGPSKEYVCGSVCVTHSVESVIRKYDN